MNGLDESSDAAALIRALLCQRSAQTKINVLPPSVRWEWFQKTNSINTKGAIQMQIAQTTIFTLTEAELQEAVKLYIQTNGYELENQELEFVGDLPQQIKVKAIKVKQHQNQVQSISSAKNEEKNVVDYSVYDDQISTSNTEDTENSPTETIVNIPVRPHFNPFADTGKPKSNDLKLPCTSDVNQSIDKPKQVEGIKPLHPRSIFA